MNLKLIICLILTLIIVEERIIEPNEIGEATIPDQNEINKFLAQKNFKSKEIEEEELKWEFYFAHGFNSCWGDCWRNCAWVDTVYLSSNLTSFKEISYEPENIDDFDLRTAWIEGKPGYGIGESLTIDLRTIESDEVKIKQLVVVNGYTKNYNTWKDNSRIKKLKLYCNNKEIGILSLEDTDKYQSFVIENLVSKKNNKYVFTFEIMDVYPGRKYEDTALSVILFEGDGCG